MKHTRRSYDTKIKVLARLDEVPDNYKKQINRSLIWKWKNEPADKYFGSEIAAGETEMLQDFVMNKKVQKVICAYFRLILTLTDIVSCIRGINKILYSEKERIVDVIQKVKATIPVKKAVKIFKISRSTYQSWLIDVKAQCFESYFQSCTRVYPNQLTKREVSEMEKLLTDKKNEFWPVNSIAYYALRKKIVIASRQTWYKYVKLLKIKRPIIKKKIKHTGIRADAPNKIWHADITIVKTLDNCKHYIYTIIDNYSRYILSWSIEKKVSGKILKKLLIESWNIAHKTGKKLQVDLIVDGGSENHNQYVDNFIKGDNINIRKLTAQIDICYSNSMVEAFNKVLKYQYLFPKTMANGKILKRLACQAFSDYMYYRPHGSLLGLTPYEAHHGKAIDKNRYSELFIKAKQERIEYNRQNTCNSCLEILNG